MAAAGVGIWAPGENPGTEEEALAALKLAYEAGGGGVNDVDENGETALHGAIYRAGSIAMAKFLIEKGPSSTRGTRKAGRRSSWPTASSTRPTSSSAIPKRPHSSAGAGRTWTTGAGAARKPSDYKGSRRIRTVTASLRNILNAARASDNGGGAMRFAAAPAMAVLLLQAHGSGVQPRIAPVPDSQWTEDQRALAARFGDAGVPSNDLGTYLHHPVLAKNIMPFERYISNESTLPARHRELLILRTAWLCRSEYIGPSSGTARKAGIGHDELVNIARGADARGWDPFEATLLRAADQLHASAFVDDATWSQLSAKYDTRGLMDAVFTVAEFTMVAGTVNSTGVQIETGLKDRFATDIRRPDAMTRNDERLIGKTARITPLEPSEWTPDVRQWLDRSGSGRPVAAIYRTYARHLAMDQPRTLVSEHIRQTSTLSPRVRELLIMRIGWLCRSDTNGPHMRRRVGARA